MTYPRITFPRVPDSRNDHYFNRYLNICAQIQSLERKKKKGDRLEKHRIIPGCLGGKYDPKNIVLCTRREHSLLHLILHKSFPTHTKIAQSASLMLGSQGSRVYESLAFIQKCEEKSLRIAESNRNRIVTWGDKISESLTGHLKTSEHLENLSSAMKVAWSEGRLTPEVCSRKGSKHKEESKSKTSATISQQKWYWRIENKVVIRTRSKDHPGEGWNLGKNPR